MPKRAFQRSFHRLTAEVAAAPLTSLTAFEKAITSLDPLLSDSSCRALNDSLEKELVESYSIAIDELASLRDWLWFDSGRNSHSDQSVQPITMAEYLYNLAKHSLHEEGFQLTPSVRVDDTRRELAGHNLRHFGREGLVWLTRSIPANLLSCATRYGGVMNHLESSTLRMLQEGRFAETHLHLGASISFAQLWLCALNVIALPQFSYDRLQSPHGFFDEGRGLASWVLISAIARMMLAKFLFVRPGQVRFNQFVDQELRRPSISGAQVNLWHALSHDLLYPTQRLLQFNQPTFNVLQLLYRNLRVSLPRQSQSVSKLMASDPISPFIPVVDTNRMDCEDQLLRTGLLYLDSQAGKSDKIFQQLFWQTQRVRGLFFRHITQQQSVRGLVWFTRYYRRISPTRKGIFPDGTQLLAGAENNGFGKGLKSFEVRTRPASSWMEVLDDVREVARATELLNETERQQTGVIKVSDMTLLMQSLLKRRSRQGQRAKVIPLKVRVDPVQFEVGLVLHFVKEREQGSQDFLSPFGNLSNENPQGSSLLSYRYADYFVRAKQRSDAVAHVLRHYPLTLQWIRGIDVCNDELGMPTWLFTPLYRPVVRASRAASAYLHRVHGIKIPVVRPTAHVGEDFRHLLTGLRRIDEALEFLKIEEGDRLGHALALGTDPIEWAEKTGPVAIDKLTRLLDLVWEWSLLDIMSSGQQSNGRNHHIEIEIQELIDELFSHWGSLKKQKNAPYHSEALKYGPKPSISELVRLRRDLASPDKLKRVGFPKGHPDDYQRRLHDRSDRILLGYLTDRQLFMRGRAIKLVDPCEKGESLKAVQNAVRRKVAARSVMIEVNPTSNLLISGYPDLTHHPLWRINSPEYRDDIPPISICVGSDDPLVFATDLMQEYQRLIDSLSKSDFSNTQIRPWIEQVRRNSLESRNTLSEVTFQDINQIYVP